MSVVGEDALAPVLDDLARERRQLAVVPLDVRLLPRGVALDVGDEPVGRGLDGRAPVVRVLEGEADLALADGGAWRVHRELRRSDSQQLLVAREGEVHDDLAPRHECGARGVGDGAHLVVTDIDVYLATVLGLGAVGMDDEGLDGKRAASCPAHASASAESSVASHAASTCSLQSSRSRASQSSRLACANNVCVSPRSCASDSERTPRAYARPRTALAAMPDRWIRAEQSVRPR